jgi:hypothetical protein
LVDAEPGTLHFLEEPSMEKNFEVDQHWHLFVFLKFGYFFACLRYVGVSRHERVTTEAA